MLRAIVAPKTFDSARLALDPTLREGARIEWLERLYLPAIFQQPALSEQNLF